MKLTKLSHQEMLYITAGGFFKNIGYFIGSIYDIHFYKGGEAGNWG